MRLDGRRESSHVDDRRGSGGAMKAGGLGLGGIIVVGAIAMLLGVNPFQAVQTANEIVGGGQAIQTTGDYTPSAQEEEFAKFAKVILAGTEDVWTEIFKQNGLTYTPPSMVLYTGATTSGCGAAQSSCGPFYCSADQCVYLDLSFFEQMQQEMGIGGDFAYAYVIAHEVGHHVQYLLGTLQKANSQRARASEKEANQISVRLELQADFYAGIWAYYDNHNYGSLEEGDIEEGINAASKIGDDYLQKQARGYSVPDSFTHGTSSQRMRWLKKGISSGNPSQGDTFSIPYSQL